MVTWSHDGMRHQAAAISLQTLCKSADVAFQARLHAPCTSSRYVWTTAHAMMYVMGVWRQHDPDPYTSTATKITQTAHDSCLDLDPDRGCKTDPGQYTNTH